MTNSNGRSEQQNGTEPDSSAQTRFRDLVNTAPAESSDNFPVSNTDLDDENGSHAAMHEDQKADDAASRSYVPTIAEIKHELWRIATGEGSEASKVSALRALADMMGVMKATPPEFPEGMSALLDALAKGLGDEG